jgi:superfamily I DNA/RNA helicase
MESPVVAVTDINHVGSAHTESLLYVAMTRATDRLILLIDKSNEVAIADRMLGGGMK